MSYCFVHDWGTRRIRMWYLLFSDQTNQENYQNEGDGCFCFRGIGETTYSSCSLFVHFFQFNYLKWLSQAAQSYVSALTANEQQLKSDSLLLNEGGGFTCIAGYLSGVPPRTDSQVDIFTKLGSDNNVKCREKMSSPIFQISIIYLFHSTVLRMHPSIRPLLCVCAIVCDSRTAGMKFDWHAFWRWQNPQRFLSLAATKMTKINLYSSTFISSVHSQNDGFVFAVRFVSFRDSFYMMSLPPIHGMHCGPTHNKIMNLCCRRNNFPTEYLWLV